MKSSRSRILFVAALGLRSFLSNHASDPIFPAPASTSSGTPPVDKSQFNLFHPTPRGLLREMEALYESPYTVDAGHIQIESYPVGYRWDREHDQTLEGWNLAPTTFKLGILNFLDAGISVAPYSSVRVTDSVSHRTESHGGFGDLVPRVRINLWGNDGGSTAFSVSPFLKIPSNQDHLGNNAYEGGLIFSLAAELPGTWWLIVTPEIDAAENVASRGYHPEFAQTFYLWHALIGPLSGYAEFASRVSTEDAASWIGTIDVGLTYMLTRNVQLDLGARFGVTRSADDFNPFVGVSVRF